MADLGKTPETEGYVLLRDAANEFREFIKANHDAAQIAEVVRSRPLKFLEDALVECNDLPAKSLA